MSMGEAAPLAKTVGANPVRATHGYEQSQPNTNSTPQAQSLKFTAPRTSNCTIAAVTLIMLSRPLALLGAFALGLSLIATSNAEHAQAAQTDPVFNAVDDLRQIAEDADRKLPDGYAITYSYKENTDFAWLPWVESHVVRGWSDGGSWAVRSRVDVNPSGSRPGEPRQKHDEAYGVESCGECAGAQVKRVGWAKVSQDPKAREAAAAYVSLPRKTLSRSTLNESMPRWALIRELDSLEYILEATSASERELVADKTTENADGSTARFIAIRYEFEDFDGSIFRTVTKFNLKFVDGALTQVRVRLDMEIEQSGKSSFFQSSTRASVTPLEARSPSPPDVASLIPGKRLLDIELRKSAEEARSKILQELTKLARETGATITQTWVNQHVDAITAKVSRNLPSPVSKLLVTTHPRTQVGPARVMVEGLNVGEFIPGLESPTYGYSFELLVSNGQITGTDPEKDTTYTPDNGTDGENR